MPNDLLARLRKAATANASCGKLVNYRFSPEQVQRGLERMREVDEYNGEESWAALLDAFLAGARE